MIGLPLKIGYSIMNLFEFFTKKFAFCSYAKRKLNKVFEAYFSYAKPEDKLKTESIV